MGRPAGDALRVKLGAWTPAITLGFARRTLLAATQIKPYLYGSIHRPHPLPRHHRDASEEVGDIVAAQADVKGEANDDVE
jgi:hypothetical protein